MGARTNGESAPVARSARPTLEMVAAAAGVSRGTASRALNGERNVSRRALEAVTRASEELGYRPNLAARSLVLGRSDSVCLVVSESGERLFIDPFFAAVMHTVHKELALAQTQLVLTMVGGPQERERFIRFAAGGHLDGVLLISLRSGDPLPAALEDADVPVVVAGRIGQDDTPGTGWWVDADNRQGARQAVDHLVRRGRGHIVTIAGPQDMSPGRDRLLGWRDALSVHSRTAQEEDVAFGDFTEVAGYQAMRTLLGRVPDVDAVFAASDLMALGAVRALREAGCRVPEDVAVVGFDDAPAAAVSDPPLTTVCQPVDEMGRAMVRVLLGRIRGEVEEQGQVVIPTRLVVRASS